jgi:tRNA/rRNA methyltransferase
MSDSITRAPSPAIILVRPQLAENIGMAARAMGNFALTDLRLVAPRDGWPQKTRLKKGALQAASGASDILKNAQLFESVEDAIADLNFVFATTARSREMVKPVFSAQSAMENTKNRIDSNQKIGILFGPERTGLTNDDVALADSVLSFPVNPDFSSINLAQAVLLTGYEWYKQAQSPAPNFSMNTNAPPAKRETLNSFFTFLETELTRIDYIPEGTKGEIITRNLRNIFHRLELNEQDIRSLRGVMQALAMGKKSEGKIDV